MTDIATLQAEVARLTAERDEMRAQILGMLPADGRDLGAENARLRALLADARDLIAEWQEVHVWGDDPIGPECGGTVMLNAIDAALAP